MTLIDKIRELIAEGETEKSLEELYDYVREHHADIIDTLVLLRNRIRGIEEEVIKGTMDQQMASLERAKVNDAILKLLPQLTPEYAAQAAKWQQGALASKPSSPQKATNWPLVGGGIALAVLVVFLVFRFGLGGNNQADAATPTQPTTTSPDLPKVDTSTIRPPTPDPSQPNTSLLAVNGNNLSRLVFTGYQKGVFVETTDGQWLEFFEGQEKAVATFKEEKRTNDSVHLLKKDGSPLQLDLQKKEVRYEGQKLYTITETFSEVHAYNALEVAYSGTQTGHFERTKPNSWVEYISGESFPDETYQEQGRDQNSIYLQQASGDIIQLDFRRGRVLFNGNDLYRISGAKKQL